MKNENARVADKSWIGRKVNCIPCGRAIVLNKEDEVKFIPDSIDGDYYQVRCHSCKEITEVSAKSLET